MTATPSNSWPLIAGRYQIEQRLAAGGMAEVYLARDQVLGRRVAVKVLSARHTDDPVVVARFAREARSAGRLNHPNIVGVYDTGSEGDVHYIAMEYVDGRTLAQALDADGPFSIDDANTVASEIADALGFAHRHGMVHRDVKPSNILINSAGTAKVVDFGIARAVEGDEDLTETGHVVGTASYISPEQAQGFDVDPRSDLYSLGVVLFEMVTGERPFVGVSPADVASKHVREDAPRPSSRRSDVSAGLDTIVGTLLAKDPSGRYPTAVELRADLDRLRNGEPVVGNGRPREARPEGDMAPTAAMQHVSAGAGRPPALDATEAMPASLRPAPEGPQSSADIGHGGHSPPPPNRTWVYVGVLGVLLILILGLAAIITQAITTNDDSTSSDVVVVPAVIGDTQADATAVLTDAGLMVDVRFEPTDEVEAGLVFAQDPQARTEVEPGATVVITVAATETTVEVPNVIDQTSDEARDVLQGLGFDVAITEAPSDSVDVGRVIAQSIPPGQQANPGAPITLTVSAGTQLVAVPSVIDQSREDAERSLRAEGFSVSVELVEVDPDARTVGRVIAQSPDPGTEAETGTTVVIRVGAASETTTTTATTTTSATTATTTTTTRPSSTTASTTTSTAPPSTESTEAG